MENGDEKHSKSKVAKDPQTGRFLPSQKQTITCAYCTKTGVSQFLVETSVAPPCSLFYAAADTVSPCRRSMVSIRAAM